MSTLSIFVAVVSLLSVLCLMSAEVKLATLLLFVAANLAWVWSRYADWCESFGGMRLERGVPGCPSTGRMPHSRGPRGRVLRGSTRTFCHIPSGCSASDRSALMTRASTEFGEDCKDKHLSSSKASELDMDHVYVTFLDFLWASYFIVPNSVFLWVKGVAVLLLRASLWRYGFISPKACDAPQVVARLLLESVANVVNLVSVEERDGLKVAFFAFLDFNTLDMDGQLRTHDRFWVEIDLESKRMMEAKLDGRQLSPEETIILLWHYNISYGHVKLHAYANWAVNLHASDAFVRRNSLVTVMYNYFGFNVFRGLASFWHSIGVTRYNIAGIQNVFVAGVRAGIHAHGHVRQLAPYSSLVDFTIKVRHRFINEFEKHKELFPGINGEALFIGTVLHSLDHTLMDDNLEDPLWLDTDHPEFGVMAELGRFVKAGFVSDVPGLMFETHFRDAPNKFFQKVYRHAAYFNLYLADHMDTCIIK